VDEEEIPMLSFFRLARLQSLTQRSLLLNTSNHLTSYVVPSTQVRAHFLSSSVQDLLPLGTPKSLWVCQRDSIWPSRESYFFAIWGIIFHVFLALSASISSLRTLVPHPEYSKVWLPHNKLISLAFYSTLLILVKPSKYGASTLSHQDIAKD
jgi:hypothetical protein